VPKVQLHQLLDLREQSELKVLKVLKDLLVHKV
jgi:hypothetical protein